VTRVAKAILSARLAGIAVALVVVSLGVAVGAAGDPFRVEGIPGCAPAHLPLIAKGRLTIGTDPLTVPPWWGGTPQSPWTTGYPPSGLGYESAVAYAVARRLGIARNAVTWIAVPARKSLARGKKPFDFYLAQVRVTGARAKSVSFSTSYYPVEQAVVGLEARPITSARSLSDLRQYKLGALSGASFSYVTQHIKPSVQPFRYQSLEYAIAGLESGEIEGLVVDFPTANSITGEQRSHSVLVGRLAAKDPSQYFGLVLQRGSALVSCVDKVLAALSRNGTLARLEREWLDSRAPVLK
jgi:polar amino acid transport system substrate-binding protein